MKWWWWPPGLIALLLMVLIALPATWLDHGLRRASHGAVGLTGARGTLWQGSGVLQVLLPDGHAATLAEMAWRIRPDWRWRPGARIEATHGAGGARLMEANIGFDGWTLAFLDLRFPAALIGTFSRTFSALGLQGDVHAHLEGVNGNRQQVRGHGEILWREASSNLTRVRPLGDYRIALDGQGDRLDIVLATVSGALRLSGNGSWRPAAGAAFRGEAVPSAETARELAPLLRLLGRDTGSGAYTLVLDDSTGLSVR